MRTRAVTGVLLGAVLATQPIGVAQPQTASREEEIARATWVTRTNGVPTRYEIQARRASAPGEEPLTTGFVATRSCFRPKKGKARVCIASADLRRLEDDRFQIDATLSQASLDMKLRGKPQTATWDASSGLPVFSPTDVIQGNPSVGRSAQAEGAAFRESLEGSDLKEAVIQRGAESRALPGLPPAPYPELPGFGGPRDIGSSSGDCWNFKRKERRFTRKMNRDRARRGKGRMRLDPELSKAARVHTREMIKRVFLHHTSEDSLRRRVTNWMILGENVGVGATVSTLHTAFMNSPAHKDNILLRGFNHVGVGTATGAGRLWVTVIFESRENPGTRLRMGC